MQEKSSFFLTFFRIVVWKKKSAVEADKLGGFHMAYQKFTGTYQSSDHINRIALLYLRTRNRS